MPGAGEALRSGDVLALAGTHEGEAARDLLRAERLAAGGAALPAAPPAA